MNVLIVLAHPERASVNGRLTDLAANYFRRAGAKTRVVDLYREGFDPVEHKAHYPNRSNASIFSPLAEQRHAWKTGKLPQDIQRQIAHLVWADLVILQFPVWWHSIPAILKGWMDRVFVSGGLYTSRMRYDKGYFRGKRAFCSVTTGAPEAAFVPGGRGGELDQILWSTQYSLYYMGFDVLAPQASFGVAGHGYSYVGDEEFKGQLISQEKSWLIRLGNLSTEKPLPYPGWDDWDHHGHPIDLDAGTD